VPKFDKSDKFFRTASELAERWNVHRSSVPRVLSRFGIQGIKFGSARQAGRRFRAADVDRFEKLTCCPIHQAKSILDVKENPIRQKASPSPPDTATTTQTPPDGSKGSNGDLIKNSNPNAK
jgi:hypothetical protein